MLDALLIYLAVDTILSVLILAVAYRKRHLIRALVQSWLAVPSPCHCPAHYESEIEESDESSDEEDYEF